MDPDKCRPIAVGMLGSDLLLLFVITLACEDAMAGGPINLANNPVPIDAPTTCGFIEDWIPVMLTSPIRGWF